MNRTLWGRLAWGCYGALALFLYAGFVLGDAGPARILGHSYAYVARLVALLPLLGSPLLLAALARRLGGRRLAFALAPVGAMLLLVYWAGSTRYYLTQRHRFDPFLQIDPPRFAPGELHRRSDGFRILAMGGSTTQNYRLPEAERYPAVLEASLRTRHPQADVAVFNAGRDWWTTKHSLINYVTHARDWKPNVVLVMHAINDVCRSFAPDEFALGAYDPLWTHFFGPAIKGAKPPPYPRHLLSRYGGHARQSWYAEIRFREVDYPIARFVALPQFEANLDRLIHYVRSDGRRIVLLTQPSLYRDDLTPREHATLWFGRRLCLERTDWLHRDFPSPAAFSGAMAAFNEATRRAGARHGVPVIDLAAALPRTLEYFTDDVHYTSKGAALVASVVAEGLEGANVLPGPAQWPGRAP